MSTPIVFELGFHALKFHFQSQSGILRELRFPWSLGDDVYETGTLSRQTLEQVRAALTRIEQQGLDKRLLYAVATSALRDATDSRSLSRALSRQIGAEIRVLTGREEASLLAEGYMEQQKDLPALIGNLGGATLELVYLSREGSVLRDSLPIGAVRVYQLGLEEDGRSWNTDLAHGWVKSCFEDASTLTADEVDCTGGTIRTVAALLGKRTFTSSDLEQLSHRLGKTGVPETVDNPRRRVLLPGLLVLQGLLESSRADLLHYTRISVGQSFLRRLLRRYGAKATRKKNVLLRGMLLQDIDLSARIERTKKGGTPQP